MRKQKAIYFFISSFLICNYSGIAQNVLSKNGNYIISISPVYSSNIIHLNNNGYDDLYLITSSKSVKIDSLMSAFSKKNQFTNQREILTEIKSQFEIYIIIKDTSTRNFKKDCITKHLLNYNNYKTAYFFPMTDSIRKYSSVVAYLIQIYNTQSKIEYETVNVKCSPSLLNDCKAVITKIE